MANVKDFRGLLVYTGGKNTTDITFANATYNIKDFVLLDREGTKETKIIENFFKMAEEICKKRTNARIWIGTLMHDSMKSRTIDETKNFLTSVKNKFTSTTAGTKIWNNNVKGVYLNMEAIYGTVDFTSPSSLHKNACIKLANDVSYFVHTSLKTNNALDFLWIPYYGYNKDAADFIKKVGHVAAKTTIFDLIVIQPSYYFPDGKSDTDSQLAANLAAIKHSTINNRVCYRDNVFVTTKESYSKSIIGFEMELDININDPKIGADRTKRYNKYVSTFDSIRKNAVPICYYAGTNTSSNNSTILSKIKDFYKA